MCALQYNNTLGIRFVLQDNQITRQPFKPCIFKPTTPRHPHKVHTVAVARRPPLQMPTPLRAPQFAMRVYVTLCVCVSGVSASINKSYTAATGRHNNRNRTHWQNTPPNTARCVCCPRAAPRSTRFADLNSVVKLSHNESHHCAIRAATASLLSVSILQPVLGLPGVLLWACLACLPVSRDNRRQQRLVLGFLLCEIGR